MPNTPFDTKGSLFMHPYNLDKNQQGYYRVCFADLRTEIARDAGIAGYQKQLQKQ